MHSYRSLASSAAFFGLEVIKTGTTAVNLHIKNLCKSFRRDDAVLHVLDGLNLSAAAGEFISVLGPSGCGKSTLFNLITGLLQPDAGDICLNGARLLGNPGVFAYMQQKDLLLPWRTVLGNVLLGPEIKRQPKATAQAEAMHLLDQLGLKNFYHSYPSQLSGGMRQRAALVRTLLLKKQCLLLDEPFGALDAMTRSVMQSILLDIWRKWQQTILLITHDVEEALLLSDRIYVLTTRPARVKEAIEVPLPHPRSITDIALVRLKRDLLTTLQADLQQGFE